MSRCNNVKKVAVVLADETVEYTLAVAMIFGDSVGVSARATSGFLGSVSPVSQLSVAARDYDCRRNVPARCLLLLTEPESKT